MNNFTAEVVSADGLTNYSCGVYSKAKPVSPGGHHLFICGKVPGKYIYIRRLPGSVDQQYLTLCEVIVDGFSTKTTPYTTPMITTTTRKPGRYISNLYAYIYIYIYIYKRVCVCVRVCA